MITRCPEKGVRIKQIFYNPHACKSSSGNGSKKLSGNGGILSLRKPIGRFNGFGFFAASSSAGKIITCTFLFFNEGGISKIPFNSVLNII